MGHLAYTKERMDKLLLPLLGSDELVEKWWASPNKAFDMETPANVWEISPVEVISYLLKQYHY